LYKIGEIGKLFLMITKRDKEIIKDTIIEMLPLIDGRFKTQQVLINAELKATENRIRTDMGTKDDLKNLEERLRADLASKEDLNQLEQRLRADLASKEDLLRFELKINKTRELQNQIEELKTRITKVEEENAKTHN